MGFVPLRKENIWAMSHFMQDDDDDQYEDAHAFKHGPYLPFMFLEGE